MLGYADESVGHKFNSDLLRSARDKTLEVIQKAARRIEPGMRELDGKAIVQEIQSQMGAPLSWHPLQIRFGENTVLPFGKKGSKNVQLKKDDIFFFDIGPIFADHEGDVGRPFTVGDDPEMKKCCQDAERIWHEVRTQWQTKSAVGAELYQFAKRRAEALGWRLALEKANGHRIADFPHAAKTRGSIEGFNEHPAPNRWILEIQIRHPHKPFGAFFEDLLN